MKKRMISVLCVVLTVFLFGCNKKVESGPQKQKVKFAAPTWNTDDLPNLVREYNASQDKYQVELVEVVSGPDLYAKFALMLQSPQTAPDVFMEDGFMIHSDSAAGLLEPLDEWLKGWDGLNQYVPELLASGIGAGGKLYGLLISTDTQGLYYNKDLFKKAEITVPWQPKNWNDIITAAEKVKKVGGDDFIPLFLFASKISPEETSMRTFQVLYSGTGGELYDFTQQKWVVDKTNLMKVYNFLNDVFKVRKLGPSAGVAAQKGLGNILGNELLKNGKVGMAVSGSWHPGGWRTGGAAPWPQALDVLGFVDIPTWDGGGAGFTSMSGGWTVAVPKNAQNKAGGIDFLKYRAGKEGMLKMALANSELATRKDVLTDSSYVHIPEMNVLQEASRQLSFTHFRPSLEGYQTISLMYTDIVENLAYGKYTPEQAYQAFKTELARIVGADKILLKE